MAETTLNDVVKTLQKGQAKDALLARSFDTWFKAMERARLDALEEARERKKAKPLEVKQERSKRPKDNAKGGFMVLGKLIGPLTAFIAGFGALGAALVGFRGWELKAIKSLNNFGGFSKLLNQKFINLRAKFFRQLGLDPKLGKAVEGKRTLATPLTTQLANAIRTWFSALQQKYFKIFGLGVDGKPVTVKGADGKIKPTSIMAKLGVRIQSIFSPITKLSTAIGGWFTGAGAKVVNFVKTFLGKGAGFVRLMGKILWPIGILISAFDGMKAYQSSEEATIFGKFGDGLAGMVGSFIGIPFDMIKNGILWIIRKVTGAEVDADGNYDTSTVSGKILQAAKDFSFTELIGKFVKAPFNAIMGVVDWIKGKFAIFSDEGEGGGMSGVMKSMFSDALALLGFEKGMSVGQIIGQIAVAPATAAIKWLSGIFGFELPEGFTLNPVTLITKYGNDAFNWVASKFGFEFEDDDFSITGWIKNRWDNAVAKMQEAFVDLGLWMSMIGPKLKVMAVEAIKEYTGSWIVSDDTLDELRADVQQRQDNADRLKEELRAQRALLTEVPDPLPQDGSGNTVVFSAPSGGDDNSSRVHNEIRLPSDAGAEAYREEQMLLRRRMTVF
jgi:hypothetical protein|tara:strand:+ start:15827 stop:17665 length:1839 start_codon:yes stop_codon:yes gene_type:complete